MRIEKILVEGNDQVINLCLDTIRKGKQALVFVNTKRAAESQAEKIASKMKDNNIILSEKALKVLSKPTKQCLRLSRCLQKNIAFHHAGLHKKQREIVEDNFRDNKIKIICATPTLAFGLNLPAFRVIIRDLKRHGGPWGMSKIPVLEYLQFCGRAGRPDYNDDHGEAICIADSRSQKKEIKEEYVDGEPENIYSKLAVEPVIRIYTLGLIATEFVKNRNDLLDFFSKTFYAKQYGDTKKISVLLDRIIHLLDEWEFIRTTDTKQDFVNANEMLSETKLIATPMGKKVSELYLDPLTAHFMIECLKQVDNKTNNFSYLQMISSTLELRPLLNVRVSEVDIIEEKLGIEEDNLLSHEWEDYDDFLNTIKTAMFFEEWINENNEEYLLEKFNIRPGEINAKLELADWLCYSAEEMCKLMKFQKILRDLMRLRARLKHGAKEELLPLLKLRNIGRIRARKMFSNGIKDIGEVKKADLVTITQLIGPTLAIDIKKQVGQTYEKVKEHKRKGQISLNDF
jgi:helicase